MVILDRKVICKNKNILYNYFIKDNLIAGLVLQGWEVKSLRLNKVNINNSYVTIINGEAFVVGLHIQPLFNIKSDNLNLSRYRKLLLSKNELDFLYGNLNKNRHTLVVISLFWKRSWCKLNIGIGIGKKLKDKRYAIKQRDWNRYKERLIKRN
ncbi:SsrA-binding protein SmpB [Candidatus Purcelliella pentastirinorum]|uniref:SsrA-binding protein SmpB n=1 Tax=Candidatus Purcelliella pentastirinorum TaxID=472834 RepID=UPI00237A24BC|nr:SsrA-binding protein SmpB [Candidatus Purcelliella pentastirinorum]WDR79900.1 SsrA-binding protein SmpB [Candidatus Purcelliella pentastirinorum]